MATKRVLQLCLILIVALSSLGFTTRAHALYPCGDTYVVQRGDWLAKIARNCGVTLSQLYAANSWAMYYRYIYPGQVLVIPGGYDGGGETNPPPVYGCGPSYDPYYGNYWVVCHGDTLGMIARYYGVSWTYLQWRNDVRNANLIYPGQFIYP
jgi:LysM repeat protein